MSYDRDCFRSGSYHSRSRSRSRSRRTPSHSPSRSHSRSPSPSVRRTPVSPEPRKVHTLFIAPTIIFPLQSRSKSPPEQTKKLAKKIKKHKKKHRKRSESRSSGEISDNDDPDQPPKSKRIKRRRSESPLESENGAGSSRFLNVSLMFVCRKHRDESSKCTDRRSSISHGYQNRGSLNLFLHTSCCTEG